jgi:hypothetical protein
METPANHSIWTPRPEEQQQQCQVFGGVLPVTVPAAPYMGIGSEATVVGRDDLGLHYCWSDMCMVDAYETQPTPVRSHVVLQAEPMERTVRFTGEDVPAKKKATQQPRPVKYLIR